MMTQGFPRKIMCLAKNSSILCHPSFIHLFSRYLLSTYYGPDVIPGTQDYISEQGRWSSWPEGVYTLEGRDRQTNKFNGTGIDKGYEDK